MFIRVATVLAALKAGALYASATPATALEGRADSVDDITVLQYATVLEHLENAFYSGALAKFDAQAFANAGFPSWVRGRFSQIAAHEASHVAFLTKALRDKAPKACEYTFPYTDPKSFAALSMILEGVGTSAYLGAAKLISNKDYLTAAGSILSVEARHDAWVASAVDKEAAWNLAYDTPLGLSGVYSLASQFIKNCPSSNPNLPVKVLPALALSPTAPTPGGKLAVSGSNKSSSGSSYVAYFSGLQVFFSTLGDDGTTTVPKELSQDGTVYIAVVSSNSGVPTDDQLLSGLAIADFSFSSKAQQ